MNEGKKGYKVVRHAAAPSKPETKKRNPVAKNVSAAIGGGAAGAHKDKKKSVKQGETKHKKRVPADMLEGTNYEKKLSILLKMEAVKNKLQAVKESAGEKKTTSRNIRSHEEQNVVEVAGPEKCWPGHRKVGTQPGTGKNAGKRVNDCEKIKKEGVAEGPLHEGKGLAGELAGFLKANGFKGPYRLGKLPKWAADLSEFDKNSLIMVQGNDVEYDEFVIDIGYGQLYWGAEGGMTKMTEKAIMNHVQQSVAEGLPQTLRKVVPGHAKREIDRKMDAGKFGKTDADKDANFQRYKKIQDKLKEQGVAEGFNGEYDDEAGMAQSNLRTMARAVDGLLKTIKNNDNLPEWGQEKIAKAEMMLVSVWDYLLSQKELGMDPKINGQDVAEGSVKNLMYDLKHMSDDEFQTQYKMSKTDARKKMQSTAYESGLQEMLDAQLAEKIPKGASAEYYIKDFEKSNAPQFRGKSKTKRREMAIAAYTASKKKR